MGYVASNRDDSLPTVRDLTSLPKAHLHLHFTGSLSVETLRRLADAGGVRLSEELLDNKALDVPADRRGWSRFQRLYDMARQAVKGEDALRTVVNEAAREDALEGSRRLEIQVDPTSYASSVGGLQPALEIILDEARAASSAHGVQVGVIVAASRLRHPLDARTLARLAAHHAGHGAGEVCGFGLNNDERFGVTPEFEGAFRIARKAGLPGVPHGGELLGPEHVAEVVAALRPTRLGHGVRSHEDPDLLARVVDAGIALEVCPASNVHLGVYPTLADVPLPQLLDAGATVALGADDPLLFLSRLVDQYTTARHTFGFDDEQLAQLARMSISASLASEADKIKWLAEVDDWLTGVVPVSSPTSASAASEAASSPTEA